VFVSHHEHEIEAFCDRVFKIEDATLVAERKIKNVPIQLVNSVDVGKVLTAAPDATMGDRVNGMTVMLIPFSEGTKEEIDNLFKMRFTRIIIIVPMIVLLALFARNQVSEFLALAELLPDNSEITISDYFMGMLNMPQFFMFFAFPILFSILIADLITDDFEEGYALFLLSRMQNRTQYILHKIYILLMVSLFFVFLVITISALTWIILKTPISGETYHYIFLRNEELSIPLIYTWMKVISFFF